MKQHARHKQPIHTFAFMAQHAVPEKPAPFPSTDAMLEAGLFMLKARRMYAEALAEDQSEPKTIPALRRTSRRWANYWHASFRASGGHVPLAKRLLKVRLNRVEREIVLVLLSKHLGLISSDDEACVEILGRIVLTPAELLKGLRALNETGRLVRHGLVAVADDAGEPLSRRALFPDPALVAMAMNPTEADGRGWPVKNEAALHTHLRRLANALQQKIEAMEDAYRGYGATSDVFKWRRNVSHLMDGLGHTLQQQPRWRLAAIHGALRKSGGTRKQEQWTVFLALLCKELGHLPADDDLFRGIGLLRAACTTELPPHRAHSVLAAAGHLRAAQWIQPCGGADAFMSDDPGEIEASEFELTPKALKALGMTRKSAWNQGTRYVLSQPRGSLDDLVLTEQTRACIKQVIAHAQHARVLFQEWGLGERIRCGRGVAMMFQGPPGTGKTAAAEALARALGKPILNADYGRIQHCFVGQTEKNIASIFREAAQRDAVLFWDEADAMFFDRDATSQSWEVRDVNVLLLELERFEGVCILATNRVAALDKALERRISITALFERPNQAARREIFRRMLPENMPLAKDVNLSKLAAYDLSGGEIKNVILNAARGALARGGPNSSVSMNDFQGAIGALKQGAWTGNTPRSIGFSL